jgi:hypothetical protein
MQHLDIRASAIAVRMQRLGESLVAMIDFAQN